ncbi:hypothetical protein F2P81_013232 [Scophthalmus maximus]|uniref:Uncharacterized protein n=1 Tax=Scophthalmus maximus TaxID=52904 RepID=A0A6A4SWM8_SCOMX|nr:hypothetical protein F2P81_013232 [Scophthalmus maximus]
MSTFRPLDASQWSGNMDLSVCAAAPRFTRLCNGFPGPTVEQSRRCLCHSRLLLPPTGTVQDNWSVLRPGGRPCLLF